MQTKRFRKTVLLASLIGLVLVIALVIVHWDTVTDWVAAASPGPSLEGIDEGLVNANNQFAFDLYAQLAKAGGNGNIFFSPLSLTTILAQTYAGARGNTAREMKETLHFDLEQTRLHAAMGTLLKELESPKGKSAYQLNIVNALWIEQSYSLLPDFVAVSRDNYRASVQSVDFKYAAATQRKRMNDWAAEQTNGKIKDVVSDGVLDSDTRLILTNAIYFKGAWEAEFEPRLTKDAPFTLADGKSVSVPTMHQLSDDFFYVERRNAQVLEMPYVGEALISMVVLLPRSVEGLGDLESGLSASTLPDWRKEEPSEREVDLYLPRFKLGILCRLDSQLRALGMRDAFSQKAADFSGVSAGEALGINAVIQEASVEVNEKGTEAVAASAAAAAKCKGDDPAPPVVFRADHPFIFLIRDMRSGSILFIGRVTNPKE